MSDGGGGGCRAVLRGFVKTFPPLKIALYINDLICYLFSRLIDAIVYIVENLVKLTYYLIRQLYRPVHWSVTVASSWLLKLLNKIPLVKSVVDKRRERAQYERLKSNFEPLKGPVPYANNLIKRLFTYQGGILLALFLYTFVYFVLVKHHTYTSVSIAFVFLLIYMILIENSHNLRSILMLCLPVMFTNRGRALVFCSMLAILAHGPIRTLQQNVKEIHSSLTCCKQYLIVKSDKHVEKNYVKRLVKVEEVVIDLVANIKQYAKELKQKFNVIIKLAIASEQYIIDAIDKLREIVNICNAHTNEVYKNCVQKSNALFARCRMLFNPFRFNLCDMFSSVNAVCHSVELPNVICELPAQVIDFVERTIGHKLKQYIQVIEREFYVDISIERKYFYNMTKSKSYNVLASEIKFDVDRKFWYVHFIQRVFNFVTLILVIWILATGTVYHMHYLTELSYDNMYLDESLYEVDEMRKADKQGRLKRRDSGSGMQSSGSNDSADIQDLISLASPPPQDGNDTNSDNAIQDTPPVSDTVQEGSPSVLVRNTQEDQQQQQEETLSPFNSPSSATSELDRRSMVSSPSSAASELDRMSVIDELDSLTDATGSNNETIGGRQTVTPPVQLAAPLEWRTRNSDDGREPGPNIDPLDMLDDRQLGPTGIRDENNNNNRGGETNQEGLFPLSKKHERQYLKPFSLLMNSIEKSKLKWSSLVWLIIIGYITFFVVLDYAFYSLVQFLVDTLRDILFTSDLPLVDFQTKSSAGGDNKSQKIVKYNRTYLSSLRKQAQAGQMDRPRRLIEGAGASHTNSSIQAFYRRLMDSIERDIPDDVAILDSLEQCLPKPQVPTYADYKMLLYLALFTFAAVIVEAYALRTRHCIANLYYPRQAKRRSVWLYKKMMSERHMYDNDEDPGGGAASEKSTGEDKPKGAGSGVVETARMRNSRSGVGVGSGKQRRKQQARQLALKLLTDRKKR